MIQDFFRQTAKIDEMVFWIDVQAHLNICWVQTHTVNFHILYHKLGNKYRIYLCITRTFFLPKKRFLKSDALYIGTPKSGQKNSRDNRSRKLMTYMIAR